MAPAIRYFGLVNRLEIVEISLCLELPDYTQRKCQDSERDKIWFHYLTARPYCFLPERCLAEIPRLLDSFLSGVVVSEPQLPQETKFQLDCTV